jgi:hypothetical protein
MEIRVIEAVWRWWRKWYGREDRVEEMVEEVLLKRRSCRGDGGGSGVEGKIV